MDGIGLFRRVAEASWWDAVDWKEPLSWRDEPPTPLFERLDLEEILAAEQNLVEEGPEDDAVHGVKVEKKKGGKPVKKGLKESNTLNLIHSFKLTCVLERFNVLKITPMRTNCMLFISTMARTMDEPFAQD